MKPRFRHQRVLRTKARTIFFVVTYNTAVIAYKFIRVTSHRIVIRYKESGTKIENVETFPSHRVNIQLRLGRLILSNEDRVDVKVEVR